MIKIIDSRGNIISGGQLGASYDGSITGGELDYWRTYGLDPNDFQGDTLETLHQRQVALYMTSPLARAAINKPLNYSIGDGIFFRSRVNAAKLNWSEEEAKKFSKDFTELLHLEKCYINYYMKQSILMREALITGDSLIYFLRGKGNQSPLDLIIDGGYTINYQKQSDDYVLGVKVDQYKRRLALNLSWNNQDLYFTDYKGNQNVVMFNLQERAGQIRGYGRNFGVIAFIKQVDRVWAASIERMVMEAIQMGYFQASDTDPLAQARAMQEKMSRSKETSLVSNNGNTTTSVKPIDGTTKLNPAMMYLMHNNENVKFTDLKTPSNNFGLANEWFLKYISMSAGYPPEFIASEYNTTYTAHKGALNDAWARIRTERAAFCKLVDKVINFEYLKIFVERGDLKIKVDIEDYRNQEALLAGKYLGPVPGHINPLQEVNANIASVGAGFQLRDDVVNQYGGNFYDQLPEWEAQEEAFYKASPMTKEKIILEQELENNANNSE